MQYILKVPHINRFEYLHKDNSKGIHIKSETSSTLNVCLIEVQTGMNGMALTVAARFG